MAAAISITDLTKTYANGQHALKGVSLEIRPGEIFALLGPNGAGKTTLISIVCGIVRPTSGTVLVEGHDFFSSPRLSPDGRRLAWLSWDHPDMPWDATRLWSAEIQDDDGLAQVRQVAGGDRESIVQPEWSPAGALYFVSDRSGWWNIHRASADGPVPVCPMSAEFAGPAWSFGSPSTRMPNIEPPT